MTAEALTVAVDASPLAVEVSLPADGVIGQTADFWREPLTAVRVQYHAHRSHHALSGEPIVVVGVTAYTRTGRNKSWMDPRHFVATGLDSNPPPAWVPDAPAWFWDAVTAMAAP